MILTILVTRITLFIVWDTDFMKPQLEDSWHHLYTGIILILFTLPFSQHLMKVLRAVGIGLFIDESAHVIHILFGMKDSSYWSWEFYVAILSCIFLVGKYYYKINLFKRETL